MTLFSNPLQTPLLTRPHKNDFYRHFGVSDFWAGHRWALCISFLARLALQPVPVDNATYDVHFVLVKALDIDFGICSEGTRAAPVAS